MTNSTQWWPALKKHLPAGVGRWPLNIALRALRPLEPHREAALRRHITRVRRSQRRDLRVLHCVRHLGPGGAERQLGYLTREAQRRGLDHGVVGLSFEGSHGHYVPALRAAGVSVRACGDSKGLRGMLWRGGVPFYLKPLTLQFGEVLSQEAPDVVHCWLDHANIKAGLAALMTGVPRVVLSTRNISPPHFSFHKPWFAPWYRFMASLPGVTFINNSRAGADDYARWLGLPQERFHTVLNGLPDDMPAPCPTEVGELRRALGIADDAAVLVGVMRLAPEKRPTVFARIACDLLREVPGAHVILVGDGPLRGAVSDVLEARRDVSRGRFHMLGHRQDVHTVLSASSVLLLTSYAEGTPNVVMEAQHYGRAVVATDAGGTRETFQPGVSGVLCDIEDVEGLAAHASRLMKDPALCATMGRAGRRFADERFALSRMVDETLALY